MREKSGLIIHQYIKRGARENKETETKRRNLVFQVAVRNLYCYECKVLTMVFREHMYCTYCSCMINCIFMVITI